MITLELGKAIVGSKFSNDYVAPLNKVFTDYHINTKQRQAAFLAETAIESAYYTCVTENFNYSANGLLQTFPHYFNLGSAATYAHQPQKIANHVYAGRYGNGDEASGDGWKFRGRGLIQVTFKNNYTELANALGKSLDDTVAYVETPEGAVVASAWYWNSRDLSPLADKDDIDTISKRVNGGTHALLERHALYTKALGLL